MNVNNGLVSIGLPVFNAEKYIHKAIESLLSQEYRNIELIISDNASTDKTAEICVKYAKMDSRIRFFNNDTNLGSGYNFKRVFELAIGEFFMWAAHDDIFDKKFVGKCKEKLEMFPEALLCLTDLVFIDEYGNILPDRYVTPETMGKTIIENISKVFMNFGWFDTYGLYRPKAIKNMRVELTRFGADVALTTDIMLRGEIVKVREPLFYYRIQSQPKTTAEYITAINPLAISEYKTPYSNLARDLVNVIITSDIEETLKVKLIDNFIDILCIENDAWTRAILKEYPNVISSDILESQQKKICLENIIINFVNIDELKKEVDRINLLGENLYELTKERPIYIWGAGAAGLRVAATLKQNKVNIQGFIDKDPTKIGVKIIDKMVTSPEGVLISNKEVENKPFIIIGSSFSKEIKINLLDYGYIENVDFIDIFFI